MLLNDKQRALVNRIDCSRCSDRRACDQIRCECPKVNFYTLQVDDVFILKPEIAKESDEIPETGFIKTTKKDFETHLYGKISRYQKQREVIQTQIDKLQAKNENLPKVA